MDIPYDPELDKRLNDFVWGCSWAFKLICDFNNWSSVESDRFIPKLVEAGIVKSEVDFYDCYFKTKNCFTTKTLTGGSQRFLSIHPEYYKYDPETFTKIDNMYRSSSSDGRTQNS